MRLRRSELEVILRRLRVVLGVLELHYDRAAREAAAGVILPCGHVNGGTLAPGDEQEAAGLISFIVEEDLLGPAAEDDHVLARGRVPVHGNHRARFDSIQHPLALIIHAITQIVILAKPW